MAQTHAIVWTDHQSARVLHMDADQVRSGQIKAHSHHTAQHGSATRTQHEFFAEVCGAIEGIDEVLVAGSHTATADLRHYVEKHRPQAAARICAYEIVDHPTDNQLVALARRVFLKHDQMTGTSPLH